MEKINQQEKAHYSEDKLSPKPNVCEMEKVLNGEGKTWFLDQTSGEGKTCLFMGHETQNILPKRRGAEAKILVEVKKKRWETWDKKDKGRIRKKMKEEMC